MPAVQLAELGLEVPEDLRTQRPGGDTLVVEAEELEPAEAEELEPAEAEELEPAEAEALEPAAAEAREPAAAEAREPAPAEALEPAEGAEDAAPAAGDALAAASPSPRPDNGAPARAGGRAATMALSDDDLEEVIDPEIRAVLAARATSNAEAAAAHARQAAVRPARVEEPRGDEPAESSQQAAFRAFDDHSAVGLPLVRARADDAAMPAAPGALAPEATPVEVDDDGVDIDLDSERPATDPGAAAAPLAARSPEDTGEEVALDDEDLQDELVAPADPSDSGEILSDELIEEVEAQAAQPVPLRGEAEAAAGSAEPGPADRPDGPGAAPAKPKPPPAPPKKASAARVAAVAAAAVAPEETGAARAERRRRAKPWFEEIFDEDYLRTLPFLTPQATQLEAQFVMESLGVAPGTQVLDVGCGYGRHAMELAARGYHVVGLDSSLPLLLRGADEAQRRGLTINFVHGDMRDMTFDAQFDGAYCLFSTFGYFDDETNKKAAANICRALKPGARCVFEVLNRDYVISDLPMRVWWEGDGCVVLEEVDFNYFSSRIQSNRSVVFDDGRQLEQEISIRSFGLHELGKLLHSVGFRVVEVSGSMSTKGRFFGAHSRDIVVVAERRVEKPGSPGPGGGEITRA
jgi:SAM-dependent methyltransferase